jgi:dihydrodipicolinate synthase/N-acetylneuraminate lyase
MPSAESLPTNGNSSPTYAFPPGIHVPSLTWFKNDKTQEIDWAVQQQHFDFLISSGLHGIVVAGTNGEAATLSSAEKSQLVQTARKTAQRLGRPDLPITLGGVAGCTRDAIQQSIEAKEAGASAYLALVPSYFHFAMSQEAIVSFFQELADASPVPIVIYNFPGVAAGLDVNSEMLDVLGQHANIVAVKLTCGGIAKVARIAARFDKSEFVALAGQSDWLVPALSVGGVGTITGVANLYPKVC